jgi:cytochrome c5
MATAKQLLVSAMISLGVAWAAPVVAADEAGGKYSINSPAKVTERVTPSAKVCVEGDACASGAPVAAAAAPAAARSADEIYNTVCAACHGTGAAGAPKTGDAAAWGPRIAQGKDTLYKHALGGFNMMPPKGTCGNCSDDEIKSVVDLLVSKAQ